MPTLEEVYAALTQVIDPDLGVPIFDLGLIYRVEVLDACIQIDFTLTSPACPAGDYLLEEIKDVVARNTGVENIEAQIVWDPPWSKEMMSDELKLEFGVPL